MRFIFRSTNLASKSARIVDFCRKSSGFKIDRYFISMYMVAIG